MVITARVPAPRVCRECEKSAAGCKEHGTCTDYAVERLMREIALAENRKVRGVEYDLRIVAMRSGRLRKKQI
jgi:hypothetical protein